MFAIVKLLQWSKKELLYSIPEHLQQAIKVGSFVEVPLRHKHVPAYVERIVSSVEKQRFEIKTIHGLYAFPSDNHYQTFLHRIGYYYQIDPYVCMKRMQSFLQEHQEIDDIPVQMYQLSQEDLEGHVVLNDEQEMAYREIAPCIQNPTYQTYVLHGVTGSGKTEVYKKLLWDAIQQGKAAMLMLPEVTLALRFQAILQKSYPHIPIIGFHSASPASEKKELWDMLLRKTPLIIIGVHLPVLLPIAHLGLIIVDEEHEQGYQEKQFPKIQSRDMAVLRAALYNIPIVLGSATPSFQTLWNIEHKQWKLISLTQRHMGSFPTIQTVSLAQKDRRECFWITRTLHEALLDRLQKKEQVILFLNRRGYSFFVQCLCGFVPTCQHCYVSLTLHDTGSLLCHYCGYTESGGVPCSDCSAPFDTFLKKGVGTQQIMMWLKKLFPSAVIARADADTTSKKRTWKQTVADMLSGEIDILVGTQSIAKGYHFPNVTLVGILWADLSLCFPAYNASEVALQQLLQVAGRAGRSMRAGHVIIQSFGDYPLFSYVQETLYLDFYKHELQKRIDFGYPPYKHIAEIEIHHADQSVVEQESFVIAEHIRAFLQIKNLAGVDLYGPVPALIYKMHNTYIQKIIVKACDRSSIIALYADCAAHQYQSILYFTMNPT